jgi:hypothetical protein
MANKFSGKPKTPRPKKPKAKKGTGGKRKLTPAQLGSIAASGSWADIPD